jgi:hypothetical protein
LREKIAQAGGGLRETRRALGQVRDETGLGEIHPDVVGLVLALALVLALILVLALALVLILVLVLHDSALSY